MNRQFMSGRGIFGTPAFKGYTAVAVAAVGALTVLGEMWLGIPWILSYLIAINLITFGIYGFDKMIAGGNLTRVPEMLLHLMAVGGGSPAAYLGQTVFRHKTVKKQFQVVFWVIVVVQVCLICWFGYKSFTMPETPDLGIFDQIRPAEVVPAE